MFFTLFLFAITVHAESLKRICIVKEIDDDNAIAEIEGDQFLMKKWSLRFSPLSFEGKCFYAKVSSSFIEIMFDDRDSIKWTIENSLGKASNQINSSSSPQPNDCYQSSINKPSPYQGNGGEVIQLTDGSRWKEYSYQYLYLYEYHPTVYVCPAAEQMILNSHIFKIKRLK